MADTTVLLPLMWALLIALVAGLVPVAGYVAKSARAQREDVTARLELLLSLPLVVHNHHAKPKSSGGTR